MWKKCAVCVVIREEQEAVRWSEEDFVYFNGFQLETILLAPGDIWQHLDTFLVVATGEGGWLVDASKHPAMPILQLSSPKYQ